MIFVLLIAYNTAHEYIKNSHLVFLSLEQFSYISEYINVKVLVAIFLRFVLLGHRRLLAHSGGGGTESLRKLMGKNAALKCNHLIFSTGLLVSLPKANLYI